MFNVFDKKIVKLPIIILVGMMAALILNIYLDPTPISNGQTNGSFITRDFVIALLIAIGFFLALCAIPFPEEIHAPIVVLWMIRATLLITSMVLFKDNLQLDHFITSNQYVPGASTGDHVQFGLAWMIQKIFQYIPFLNSFSILSILWSFLGLIGIILIYFGFSQFLLNEKPLLIWILGLTPSVFFWSISLSHSPIYLFSMGLLFYSSMVLLNTKNYRSFLPIIISLLVMYKIQFWLPFCSIAALTVAYIQTLKFSKKFKIGLILSVLFVTGFILSLWLKSAQISLFTSILQKLMDHGNDWHPYRDYAIANSLKDYLFLFVPMGLVTSLFRPFPGEWNHIFGYILGLENICLIFGVIWSFSKFKSFQQPSLLFVTTLLFFSATTSSIIYFNNPYLMLQDRSFLIPLLLIFICFHFEKNKSYSVT